MTETGSCHQELWWSSITAAYNYSSGVLWSGTKLGDDGTCWRWYHFSSLCIACPFSFLCAQIIKPADYHLELIGLTSYDVIVADNEDTIGLGFHLCPTSNVDVMYVLLYVSNLTHLTSNNGLTLNDTSHGSARSVLVLVVHAVYHKHLSCDMSCDGQHQMNLEGGSSTCLKYIMLTWGKSDYVPHTFLRVTSA